MQIELSMQNPPSMKLQNATICIIGTGWMARALGRRLASSATTTAEPTSDCIKHRVVFGSRHPYADKAFDLPGPLLSIPEAIAAADSSIIILAVPQHAHSSIASAAGHLLCNRVVVDICNCNAGAHKCGMPTKQHRPSQLDVSEHSMSAAEKVQQLLPSSFVVKAFNTVSAYELDSDVDRGVPCTTHICGDHTAANEAVKHLAQQMGLTPVLLGSLQMSRELERRQYQVFPSWHAPTALVAAVFAVWLIYTIIWYLVLHLNGPVEEGGGKPAATWSEFPLKVMNTIVASTGATALALTYLPGVIASICQLLQRDAVSAFPAWLSGLMNMRKQLGLWAFWLLLVHAIISVLALSPETWWSMYDALPFGRGFELNWLGQTSLLLGVLAFAILVVMTICSLPGVGSSLSYMEWRFVFTYLGYMALTFALGHILIYGLSYDFCAACHGGSHISDAWPTDGAGPIPPPGWITVGVVGLPLVLRLLLCTPPLSIILGRLRRDGVPRAAHKHLQQQQKQHKQQQQMGQLSGTEPGKMLRFWPLYGKSAAAPTNSSGSSSQQLEEP